MNSIVGPQCNRPIGMENRRIRSNQISASSEWDINHGARLARLNQRRTGRTMGAWSARVNNHYQYLQVDLRVPMKVTSVATQGRSDASQWVTRYMLSYSIDGAHFAVYWSQGRPWVCYFKCWSMMWIEKIEATFSSYLFLIQLFVKMYPVKGGAVLCPRLDQKL